MSDAKDRLPEIFRLCLKEPQIVYDQNQPIGVIVDVKYFNEFMNSHDSLHRPTITELLDELREIHKLESVEIDVPPRQDRPNILIEDEDELSL